MGGWVDGWMSGWVGGLGARMGDTPTEQSPHTATTSHHNTTASTPHYHMHYYTTDMDNSASLNRTEFNTMIESWGHRLSTEELDDLFEEINGE